MDFKDILAISGHSGLFRFVSRGRVGVIVESITDEKKTTIPTNARISSMDDISVYTEDKDLPLPVLLRKMYEKENGGPAISHKSDGNALKSYFAEVLPDYDRDRVYTSDIKKIIQWYNILQAAGIMKQAAEEAVKAAEEETKSEEAVKTNVAKAKKADTKAVDANNTETKVVDAKDTEAKKAKTKKTGGKKTEVKK